MIESGLYRYILSEKATRWNYANIKGLHEVGTGDTKSVTRQIKVRY